MSFSRDQVLKLPTGNDNTGSASTYTVKAGDTLWDIAQSQLGNGSRYKEIMTLNGLTSDIIQPGQVLKLPVGGASNAGSDTTKTYTVKTGDTLLGYCANSFWIMVRVIKKLFH